MTLNVPGYHLLDGAYISFIHGDLPVSICLHSKGMADYGSSVILSGDGLWVMIYQAPFINSSNKLWPWIMFYADRPLLDQCWPFRAPWLANSANILKLLKCSPARQVTLSKFGLFHGQITTFIFLENVCKEQSQNQPQHIGKIVMSTCFMIFFLKLIELQSVLDLEDQMNGPLLLFNKCHPAAGLRLNSINDSGVNRWPVQDQLLIEGVNSLWQAVMSVFHLYEGIMGLMSAAV